MANFKLSGSSQRNLEGIHEYLILTVHEALKVSHIDFGIPSDGGLRAAKRQRELFNEGLSQLDGYKKKSYHQTGKAFDVFAYVGGASWDKVHLAQVAGVIMSTFNRLKAEGRVQGELRWGGNWTTFVDMPHFELHI